MSKQWGIALGCSIFICDRNSKAPKIQSINKTRNEIKSRIGPSRRFSSQVAPMRMFLCTVWKLRLLWFLSVYDTHKNCALINQLNEVFVCESVFFLHRIVGNRKKTVDNKIPLRMKR